MTRATGLASPRASITEDPDGSQGVVFKKAAGAWEQPVTPLLSEMSAQQRREFHTALLEADIFEDMPGKWQAAILNAEQNQPKLRLVSDA